jgi:transposase
METATENPRAVRGLALVRDKGVSIRQIVEDKYLVPSQTLASGGYVVDASAESCTCPDWAEWGSNGRVHRCKHVWATLIFSRKIELPDGSVVVKRVTIQRDWAKYNQGQEDEKPQFQVLLRALCDGILQPPYAGNGRPALPLADVVFGATMKVFNEKSVRRLKPYLMECHDLGLLGQVPSKQSMFRYIANPALTPLLQVLIHESAAPLVACETHQQYAIDSTGFATGVFGSYCDNKHKERRKAKYIKAHAIVCTHTHVVTYVKPTEGHVSDMNELEGLVAKSTARYPAKEISADAGYLSKANAEIISNYKAVPYIDFRDDSVGTPGPEAWNTMWHHFKSEQKSYRQHYHRRSNVETVFSMVKAKFGERLQCRTLTAQYNEVLLRFLAHNLSCTAMAIHTLGLTPKFDKIFSLKGAA